MPDGQRPHNVNARVRPTNGVRRQTPPGVRRRTDAATYELPPPNVTLDRARGAGEWLGIIGIAVAAALLVKVFAFELFFIPSGSMETTLMTHDYVMVNKLTYKLGDVHRGDIVVFKRPPLEPDKSINDLIKRVIGLPGDTVESRDGLLYLNGELAKEPYLDPGVETDDLPLTTIPPGELWVMGDNRENSGDSRVFGPISEHLLVGKAIFRVLPVGSFGPV